MRWIGVVNACALACVGVAGASGCGSGGAKTVTVTSTSTATASSASSSATSPGSTLDPRAKALPYNDDTLIGSFRCASRTDGMTCTNTTSGHGFFIAVQSYRTF